MDETTVGAYTVTYNVTDANGNAAVEVTRTVNVIDTTIPVITLVGDATLTVEVGSTYTDDGATATDNYDGNLTASIVTVNPVDETTVGAYTVTYNVTDANGNAAVEVTRTVNVELSLSVDDFLIDEYKVFPNPTSSSWKIISSKRIDLIEIFDLVGRRVILKKPIDIEFEVDASSLPSGVYIMITNRNKITKLIKN